MSCLPQTPRQGSACARAFAGVAALLLLIAGPAAAAPQPLPTRWDVLQQNDLRVATVGYRLSIANRALCHDTLAAQPGFVLHGIAQYAPADRAEAMRRFGLDDHPGVMAVVANSPAALAGLRAGDRLLSVNGRPLGQSAPAATPDATAVEADRAIIAAEMRSGPIVLRVNGAAGVRDIRLAADGGCATNIAVLPGTVVNAWADGHGIAISSGLLARCPTDDDLALVIAHEMAHNLLHHPARLAATALSALPDTPGSGSAAMRETEEEADRLGVRLTASAYDLRGAAAFLRGLIAPAGTAATHPAPARRLNLLAAEIAREGRRLPQL